MPIKNIVGLKFGKWTIVERVNSLKVRVVCECGTEKILSRCKVLGGHSKSCGCSQKEFSKATFLEKYGVETIFRSEEVRAKIRATSLERYGTETPQSSDKAKKTRKETNKQKFGVEHNWSSPEVREKCHETMLQKYGVKATLELLEIQKKCKETRLAKYGVACMFDLPEYRELGEVNSSKGELELLEFVRQFYPNACSKIIGNLESQRGTTQIDIYIPELKLCIEYNGIYWHSEKCGKGKYYHKDRMYLIKQRLGCKLIYIWEYEWKTRKEQVKNFLLSALKVHAIKIGARKCEFRFIDIREACKFLDSTHIQGGNKRSDLAIGAYYQGELVCVSTFGKHHRNNKDNVLNRFASKSGVTVVGALSKMSKMAVVRYKTDLISWFQLDKGYGEGYSKAGWVIEDILEPDYVYTNGSKIISKQSRRKEVCGTPEDMTEFEHAVIDGLYKIWDCGKCRVRFLAQPFNNIKTMQIQ